MGICFEMKSNDIGRRDIQNRDDSNNINNDKTQKYFEETIFNFKIEETNEIQTVNKDMYDAIFSCESIKELFDKGWKYKLSHKFIQRFYRKEKTKFCPLCVIGETNKGKTFIVNLLTGNKLQSGIEFKTEGISCKLTNFKNDDE